MVDMPANTWKQSIEYARFLNVPDEVQSIRSQFKLLSTCRYRTETYPEHCQTYKMERFVERIMNECKCATRNFSWQGGHGGGVKLGHFNKNFVKNKKKGSQRETFWCFLPDIAKTIFWIEWWTQSRPFFPKSIHFFQFLKMAGDASLLPVSCAPLGVFKYTLISLNIEYAYISSKMLEYTVLTMQGLWICLIIWHIRQAFGDASKSKYEYSTVVYVRVAQSFEYLIMAPYASIMLEYASVCLNAPQYVWTWLNIAECPWICLKMPE